jgi:hypothetical protein
MRNAMVYVGAVLTFSCIAKTFAGTPSRARRVFMVASLTFGTVSEIDQMVESNTTHAFASQSFHGDSFDESLCALHGSWCLRRED